MILICTASNGKNLILAHTLDRYAKEMNIPTTVIDLTTWNIPLYTPQADDAGSPKIIGQLEDKFSTARGFVFCAPEYNGSIPPVLTNAIAWISTASDNFRAVFNGKPAAIATYSGGAGQKVLIAMRLQLSHLGVNVLGREIATNDDQPLRESTGRTILATLHRSL